LEKTRSDTPTAGRYREFLLDVQGGQLRILTRRLCGRGDHGARTTPQRSDDPARPRRKNFAGIQELHRDKNIRTTVRYTQVGYEQTR
jgi:hypothetical protein